VMTVMREQAGTTLGLSPVVNVAQLPPAQLREIRDALFAGWKIKAIKLHREFTGASLSLAKFQIEALSTKLYREQPEKFVSDPTLPPRLDWKRVCVLVFIGGIALGIVSFFLPKSVLPSWPLVFFHGMTFGAGATWPLRRTDFRHRMLAFVPCIIFSFIVYPIRDTYNPHMDFRPLVLGVFAGIALIRSAQNR